jgi:hypothetical protein
MRIIKICFLGFLIAKVSLALNAQDIKVVTNTKEAVLDLTKKEKFIYKLHNYHSPTHVGFDDPNLPAFLQFKPTLVNMPLGFKVPQDAVVIDDKLELRSLTHHLLQKMSPTELRALIIDLATIEVKIKWSNNKCQTKSGKKRNHWEKSNAATALALSMAMQYQEELFVAIIAAAPNAILDSIHGHMFGLINPTIMANIISTMLLQLDGDIKVGTAGPITRHIAQLIQRGLVYWVNKDIIKLYSYLTNLLSRTVQTIDERSNVSKEQLLGILLGSLLAGTLKHTDAIKVTDEKRIWFIGVVANFAWAATTFIGAAPMAAPFIAATAGGLSVGAVLSTTILTALDYPRNYTPTIKEIEGNFEMAALEAAQAKSFEEKINSLLMLKWMQAAIHVNGLSD